MKNATPDIAQRDQIIAILNAARDLTLATVRADGAPHATTLAFANDGLAIYFGTSAHAEKAHNIARDNRVSLTVNRPYANWGQIEGLALSGRAFRVSEPEEFLKAGQLLFTKFPEAASLAAPESGSDVALFRIDPTVGLLLDYRKGHGWRELIEL